MEFLTLLIIAVLGVCALALILFPLWQQSRPNGVTLAAHASGQTLEEVEARYYAELAAIKDLMFDHEMGKISPDDYELILTRAKMEAAQLRRQLDRLTENPDLTLDPALDAKIEALINQTRTAPGPVNGNRAILKEIDGTIKRLRTGRNGKTTACPECNTPFQAGDAFCSSCGTPLSNVDENNDAPACPNCRSVVRPDDAFCTECGTALEPMAALQYNEV